MTTKPSAPKSAASVARANSKAFKAQKISKTKLAELEIKIVELPTKPANPKAGAKAAVAAAIKEAPQDKAQDAALKAPKADGRNRPDTWILSETPKPTKKVWIVADSMPGKSRKEVIAECIRQGIAPGTSRTQYQAWYKAMRDSGTPAR